MRIKALQDIEANISKSQNWKSCVEAAKHLEEINECRGIKSDIQASKTRALSLLEANISAKQKDKVCVEAARSQSEISACNKYFPSFQTTSSQSSPKNKDFDRLRAEALKYIETNISRGQKRKSCVEAAKHEEEINGCINIKCNVEASKTSVVKDIQAKISRYQKEKSCVEAAKNGYDIRECQRKFIPPPQTRPNPSGRKGGLASP
ncbi:MAG: hypothetical protein HQK58_03860 [Deltaproteobacteria bacterium]|nr:hypothetical protein [Deltaproteobacteria bacterium]